MGWGEPHTSNPGGLKVVTFEGETKRERDLATALLHLMSFTRERFAFVKGCTCHYCQHYERAITALRSGGHGDNAIPPTWAERQ